LHNPQTFGDFTASYPDFPRTFHVLFKRSGKRLHLRFLRIQAIRRTLRDSEEHPELAAATNRLKAALHNHPEEIATAFW
jgi:hypothetical protein